MATPGQGHYGKFRATVVNNDDPLKLGRLIVSVPDVSNVVPSTWAMPCFPFAGIQNGFIALPVIGSGVWVEYEQGNSDFPIWTGCYFGASEEMPALALAAEPSTQTVVIQTAGQNTFMLSDMPGETGGILLKSSTGALISITDTGILISNGQGATITLNGPSVNINEGALEVI